MSGANGNNTNLTSVVADYGRQTNPLQLIKKATLERSVSSRHHDVCTTMQARVGNPLRGGTHNIDGKTWRAELVSDTIHDSIVSTTESHRHVENSHRTKSQEI